MVGDSHLQSGRYTIFLINSYPYRLLNGVPLPFIIKFFCVCGLKGSEEADYEWDDGAVNDCYKGEMPKWLSDEDQQRCYVVTLFCLVMHKIIHVFHCFVFHWVCGSIYRLNNQSFMTRKTGGCIS